MKRSVFALVLLILAGCQARDDVAATKEAAKGARQNCIEMQSADSYIGALGGGKSDRAKEACALAKELERIATDAEARQAANR